MDLNNDRLVKLSRAHDLSAFFQAIRQGIVVNPRGMEPVGAKGIFELVTGRLKTLLSATTITRTPWTRYLSARPTTGPSGEVIDDLLEWSKIHYKELILKPIHGFSGKGILIGYKGENPETDIEQALRSGDYIVQQLIPLSLWAERYPTLDHKQRSVKLHPFQTDFRCFITDEGLIGFVARFGGIPTNVGSGGGTQAIAILRSPLSIREALDRINEAILDLGYHKVKEIQDDIDKEAIRMGHTYLLGPIPVALRPRLITAAHIEQLKIYSRNLWQDAIKLEKLWQEGKLRETVKLSPEEEGIASMQPWGGSPAIIAPDGLFSFGGHL